MTHQPNKPVDPSLGHASEPGFVNLPSPKSSELGGAPLTEMGKAESLEPNVATDTADRKTRIKKPGGRYLDDLDAKLVDQTKHQIRTLVQEITDLSRSECSVEDFYEGFLTRTTSALASIGGAIWIRDSVDDPLKLHYHINLKQTKLAEDAKAQTRHGQLLKKLCDQGEPALIGPDSGAGSNDMPGNPTECMLVVGPLTIDNETVGLVEIFQRPGAGPATQRGYLRFLIQMCEIASDFLRNQKIRSFAEQQRIWQQLEQFIRLVHRGLDTDQTVFTLANEGRRLIDCDRVSVAMGRNRHCRVKAVSGLDSIERRSEQVKRLGSLAATVIRAGQPLWYSGDEELPPQIENQVHAYVDKSHTRMLAILPLFETENSETDETVPNHRKPKPMGALILEQLKDSRITPALENRANIVVEHGQTAITNAAEHNGIFLMPLWKALGKVTSVFSRNQRGKTFLALATLAGIIAFLTLFPYSFGLGAKGSLIPEMQHEVFAKANGTIEELFVSDDGETTVGENQTLARMKNSDVELAISELTGRIAEAKEEIRSNGFILNGSEQEPLSALERVEIDGRIRQAKQLVQSLEIERQIRYEERDRLEIKSPAAGRVINWNVRQNLLHRPVQRGQKLMTIVHPETEWMIELEMPEKRLHHLFEAQKNNKNLTVTFGLMSNPGTEYEGRVVSVDKKLDVYSDEGNTALVRVAFDNSSLDPELLRTETRVMAKVQCGTRSIGYVMFHELFETVQSTWMFWF